MRVTIEHPGIILQNEKLLKSLIPLQVFKPLSIGSEDPLDLLGIHGSEILFVPRCLHHNFMSPDGLHHIIHPLRPSIKFALNVEERKFIGNDTNRPPSSLSPYPESLFGSHFLMARAEWTEPSLFLRLIRRLEGEVIRRPFGIVGRNDNPHTGDGFFPQICHAVSYERSDW
jgi:hypothetical protein